MSLCKPFFANSLAPHLPSCIAADGRIAGPSVSTGLGALGVSQTFRYLWQAPLPQGIRAKQEEPTHQGA